MLAFAAADGRRAVRAQVSAQSVAVYWQHGSIPSKNTWVFEESPEPAEAPLHCRPEVIEAFQKIWKMAGSGRRDYEAGFRIDAVGSGYHIVYAPMSYERFRLMIPIVRGVTVAIAHTHPDSASPKPLGQDLDAPVLNYVVSRRALWVSDPAVRRASRLRRLWRRPCAK